MDNQLRIACLMVTVIVSCCINVISLELMVKDYPSCIHLITLSQFLFSTSCSFSLERFRPKVPIRQYLSLVVLYFLVTLAGNYALAFNISMPLHMIFKSGSLIANMVLSIIVFGRKYKLSKYLSVFTITLGIILCTLASSKNITAAKTVAESKTTDSAYSTWLMGLGLLVFSVVGAAQTGIFQEKISTTYGRYPDEMMFYCHALLLPSFLFLSPNIRRTINHFSESAPIAFLPFEAYPLALPKLWVFLFVNVLSCYCCSKSVFLLNGLCTSLTITLLITLRKFFSLILSIQIFKNVFTLQHWLGTVLVFGGTLIFAEINLLNLWPFKRKPVDDESTDESVADKQKEKIS